MRRDGGALGGLMRDVNSPPGAILARSGAPDILCRMGLRRKLLLAALMTACGTPDQQVATSTGITTVQPGESSAGSSSNSTGSSSSTGGTVENSTGTSTGSTSEAPLPDMPGFDTLGPVEGCGKIDILFVINDGGDIATPVSKEESTYDALSIRNGTTAFLTAMQEQASEYDLQVMAVKGDPLWEGTNGPSGCCVPDKPCDELGPYPCDPPFGLTNDCDYTLGAGVRYPAGFMASNRDCELAGGHRYLTETQDDFAGTFDCILNVGQTGTQGQKYLAAMVQAVGPTLNAPGGCNRGFLRPDAMLVVVILTDFADTDSPGTPEGLAASLIAAKDGYAGGIVVVGVLSTVAYENTDYCGDLPDDRTRKFVEGFPKHVLGSLCAPDIGVNLVQAVDVIQAACAEFAPPG